MVSAVSEVLPESPATVLVLLCQEPHPLTAAAAIIKLTVKANVNLLLFFMINPPS